MCTAISFQSKNFYFGRTLDYDLSYGEEVAVTPRGVPLHFSEAGVINKHYAMIGTAFVPDRFPLYYDAVNEKGLCIAGLNFVGNAVYRKPQKGKCNLAHYELIGYLLAKCADLSEVKKLLNDVIITDTQYGDLPPAQLHWLIADRTGSITLESVADGLKVYENPVGALTNNPPFPLQTFGLNQYMGLSAHEPVNNFSDLLPLAAFSRGMGAIGLPGDGSSPSRFVRVVFNKFNCVCGSSETESVNQFFHLLGSVEQIKGTCIVGKNGLERTIYTSCCNADRGIYYYTTYENRTPTAVNLHNENLDGQMLVRYPFDKDEKIIYGN